MQVIWVSVRGCRPQHCEKGAVMSLKMKKGIVAILTLALALIIICPQETEASSKPHLSYFSKTVYREEPGWHFNVFVDNIVKGATYTATVSDKKIAQLSNVDGYEDGDYVNFLFYAKRPGKVKVTIKQTLNNKTKKVGSVTFTIKSRKFSAKEKKRENKYRKIVNSGSDAWAPGVSLEVLSISNIKNGSKKITAKATLRHDVTAEEYKLSEGTLHIFAVDKKGNTLVLTGKLKKGKDTVTLSESKKYYEKKLVKKGKVYYVTGLNTQTSSPYKIKVKL